MHTTSNIFELTDCPYHNQRTLIRAGVEPSTMKIAEINGREGNYLNMDGIIQFMTLAKTPKARVALKAYKKAFAALVGMETEARKLAAFKQACEEIGSPVVMA